MCKLYCGRVGKCINNLKYREDCQNQITSRKIREYILNFEIQRLVQCIQSLVALSTIKQTCIAPILHYTT